MKIQNFNVSEKNTKAKMISNLKEHKLENIKSLWYFVRSGSRSTVIGSTS